MNLSAFILTFICSAFLLSGYHVVCTEKISSKASGLSNSDIFIDDTQQMQNDQIEGSAVDTEFTDRDDHASGMGPDDEDAINGSGEGSGAGWRIPTETTKAPIMRPKAPFEEEQQPEHFPVFTEAPPKRPKVQEIPIARKPSFVDDLSTTRLPAVHTTQPPTFTPPRRGGYDINQIPDHIPPEHATKVPLPTHKTKFEDSGNDDDDDNNDLDNDVGFNIQGQRSEEKKHTSFFAQPGILAAIIAGSAVGLLCLILVSMFIIYRIRKPEECIYAPVEYKLKR